MSGRKPGFPPYCCQECGELVGYVGRWLEWLFGRDHKCIPGRREPYYFESERDKPVKSAILHYCAVGATIVACVAFMARCAERQTQHKALLEIEMLKKGFVWKPKQYGIDVESHWGKVDSSQ